MRRPFIMLAPMEGVIDAVTRALYSEIGGFDRFATEFVRVTDKQLPAHVFFRYCPELKNGGKTREGVPVFLQLLGGRPEILAENAFVAVDLGALGIDLNFGCPATTVNRHDGGATLLKNPNRLFDVISQVRKAVGERVPVTAKVRLGFENKDSILEIARAVDEAGAATLTIHARTKSEGYRPPAHWEFIARMKEVVRIPVVANGDIWSVSDYLRCREISGCEDVALGRGAMATPDLALQIRAHLSAKDHESYDWAHVQKSLLPKFMEMSGGCRTDHNVVGRTKQWVRQLVRGYSEAEFIFERVKMAKTSQEISDMLLR